METERGGKLFGVHHEDLESFLPAVSDVTNELMIHAGAIITGGQGTAKEKIAALEAAGVRVVRNPAEIGETVKAAFGG